VVNNKIINEAILEAQLKVLEGHAFHEAMFATNRFSSLVIRMIKIGEESGNLDNTLNNVNAFYDKEIKDAIGAMIALIQPVFTVILGMVMLWIAMSIFGPIYSSFDKMNF
jgi:type IV pilus assembly protein PilC